MPQPVLTTARLVLRPWDPDDPADVAAALDIYRRDEVARWLGAHPAPWPSEPASHDRLLLWQEWGLENPGHGVWAIVPEGSAEPVGSVLLGYLPDGEGADTTDIEIGWHLHPDVWGLGYATEAALGVLEHARTTLGLTDINALAYPDNTASLAVMSRIGLVWRGQTDRWYGVQLQWWSTP